MTKKVYKIFLRPIGRAKPKMVTVEGFTTYARPLHLDTEVDNTPLTSVWGISGHDGNSVFETPMSCLWYCIVDEEMGGSLSEVTSL